MAFFKKSKEPKPKAAEETAADAFGAVVRTLGEVAFDTDEMGADRYAEICEAWARHLTTGVPSPLDKIKDEAAETTYPEDKRAWTDARRFVVHSQRAQQRFLDKSFGDLKAVIWNFAKKLRAAVIDDGASDQGLLQEINDLGELARSGSVEDLRAKALHTVEIVSTSINQRRERYENHLQELGARLAEMRSDLLEARRQMETDGLTKVYNRGAFDAAIERYVSLSFFSGEPLSLLLIDLDHFKAINDTHGHQAGDAVLVQVASQLLRRFPRGNDFVARYGGEEFVVLLPGTDAANGAKLAERLVQSIRALHVEHEGQEIPLTCSVGLAILRPQEAPADLIRRADQALYAAKSGGRDQALAA